MKMINSKGLCNGVVFLGLFLTVMMPSALAGFLDMPDTSEVPEYERGSLMLDMDIPPVRERDPDPEGGPRLNVREFRLQGVVEYPELGITREDLARKVESLRFEYMQEGDRTESGYTVEELGEISDLIADIEQKAQGDKVSPVDVQKLVFLIREQRRRRGITLGMIETVADAITQYYRERGFILAKAYIPEQKVRDGVVTLTLLLGELGGVEITNAHSAPIGEIQKIFNKSLFKPVTNWNIEESLYLINDLPGISAQGFFQPGKQVGDTELNVNIMSEKKYSANLRFDNHGSGETGRFRPYADFILHNPAGYGDELSFGAYATIAPENTLFGFINYSFPLYHPKLTASIGLSSNDFIFTPEDEGEEVSGAEIGGKALTLDMDFKYKIRRSRTQNYNATFTLSSIETQVTGGSYIENVTSAVNARFGFDFDLLNERKRGLTLGSIQLLVANETEPTRTNSSESETNLRTVLLGDFSQLMFVPLPFAREDSRLLIKSSFQIAGQHVSNINQSSVSGPYKARGYDVGTGYFDDLLYAGVDWYLPMLASSEKSLFGYDINDAIQPYLLADIAGGIRHALADGVSNVNGKFFDLGAGVNFHFGAFKSNLIIAAPIIKDVGLDDETVPGVSAFFDLQYSF